MAQVAPGSAPNAMEAVIAAAVAKALNGKTAKRGKQAKGKGREKLTDEQRAGYMAANDAACIAAFTKAGFADVKPRINVLTYGKVKKGEKAIRVGPFALFHESQTEVLAA